MELISKDVVRRIIDSGRTKEQMLGMVECAVTYGFWAEDSSTECVVTFGDSDDCISRSEAIRIASGYCHWTRIPEELAKLPSVRPKERMGHWIAVYQGDEIINYRCTECEFGNTFGKSTYRMNYCPNCGAKMQ